MSGLAAWVKVLIALVSLVILINNREKIESAVKDYTPQPGNQPYIVVNPAQPASPNSEPSATDKIKETINKAVDWIGGNTQFGNYQLPNWALLLGAIIFIGSMYRR